MNKSELRKRLVFATIGLTVAATVAGMALPISAHAMPVETSDLLSKTVAFNASPRTVEEIAKMLADLTGVKIEPESCLRERIVVLHADHNTANEILGALAELHDWRLEETDDHKILIRRQIVRPAATLKDLPGAVRAALPKDLRNYLGLGVPADVVLVPQLSEQQQQLLKSRKSLGPNMVANTTVQFRIDDKARHAKRTLIAALSPTGTATARKRWNDLAKPLQRAVLLSIIVNGLQYAFQSAGGKDILTQRLYPFEADPSRIVLKLTGQQAGEKVLMIGSTTTDGKRRFFDGFGGSVD